MDCGSFGKYLDNYENLNEDEKLEMTEHAAECESCSKELDFMLSIIETSKSLPKIELPSDFIEKLNVRIDAEEKKKRSASVRLAVNVRKNWRQYTAAAACLALVAVITSNGMSLVGKMPGSDDSKDYNVAKFENDVIPQSTPSEPIEAVDVNSVQTEDTVANANVNISDKPVSNSLPTQSVREANTRTAVASAKRTADTIATPKTEVNEEVISTENEISHEETAMDGVSELSDAIAVASVGGDESGIAAYINDAQDYVKGRSVQDNYSIADGSDIMIAKYEPPADGEDADSKKAIGKIKISSEDIDEAMDVIMQHAHDVSGDLYTTDSANLSLMISSLIQKGVSCTNYTPPYKGNIKFQLVIE